MAGGVVKLIHLVLGYQGSGKTLFLIKIARENYLAGKTVYSNIALKFPYKPIDYNDIINCKYENAVVLIDEIHLLLPARTSGFNPVNKAIVDNFLSMVRKKNLEVYGTTQTPRKVDIRFREEADFIYYAEKFAFMNGCWGKVIHNQDLDKKVPIKILLEVRRIFDDQIITLNFNGNYYFNLYDSKQIIEIKGIKKK